MATCIAINDRQFCDLVANRVLLVPDADAMLVLDHLSFEDMLRAVHQAMPLEHVELADRCVALTTERDRLLYWTLRLLQSSRTTAVLGAMRCLEELECAPASERARNILRLGEPGLSDP